ncbi:MAG TPA: SurA N-terminal domain-containing protein, partial [Nevskiaceae bacterium]|nr:SurA N-terminal domain-containing protein [Nevskiaceae bacterium]
MLYQLSYSRKLYYFNKIVLFFQFFATSNYLKKYDTMLSMAKKVKLAFKLKLDKRTKKVLIILFATAFLAALLFNIKHYFIAAMVGGRPITRRALDKELEKQMGKQVLEGLISQTLVRQEAKKQKVEISNEDLEGKINQIEAQLEAQGQELDSVLATQGQTRKDLEQQIELQLIVEEILTKDINITDEELKDYFEESKELLPEGTTLEDKKDELREELRQQKIGEKFQPWLIEL